MTSEPVRHDTSIDALCDQAVRLMGLTRRGVKALRLRAGDLNVEIEWAAHDALPLPEEVPQETPPDGAQEEGFHIVSPLVGTLYRSPAPGEPPFVEVGDEIAVGQQVAIVEAMKLMNPVEADQVGRVVDVLVPDGTPVEYDQPLFRVIP